MTFGKYGYYDATTTWGPAYSVSAWAGFPLARNLLLSGELYDAHVFNPSSTEGEVTDLSLLGFGPGLRYYLGPTNLYLAGSLLLSRISIRGPEPAYSYALLIDEHTRWGATGRLALGQDWQVSHGWKLGFEGEIVLGWMKRKSGSSSDAKGFSLLFSAAYNRFPSVPRFLRSVGWRMEARLGVGQLWGRYADEQARGTSVPTAFSTGWRPARNLVLFGEFTNVRMRTANVRNESSVESADLLGAGAGLKYYLTPSRAFVTLSLARSWLVYHDQDYDWVEHSQKGFAGRFAIGKEWWLSRHWSLGVAGEVVRGELRPRRDASYATGGVSLLGLASYDFTAREELEGAPAAPASEPGPPPSVTEPGRHTHEGFYVGVRHGVGWLTLRDDDYWLSGRGWPLALSAGHTVARNLIVFGELYEMQIRRPQDPYSSSFYPTEYVDLDFLAFGPGATYYLMPINLFASGSLWLAQASYRNDTPLDDRYGINSTYGWNLAGRFSLGKEWWVSSNWGIGIAGEVLLGRLRRDNDAELTAKGYSLLISASFN